MLVCCQVRKMIQKGKRGHLCQMLLKGQNEIEFGNEEVIGDLDKSGFQRGVSKRFQKGVQNLVSVISKENRRKGSTDS